MDYSRVYITKTLTNKPSSDEESCVKVGEEYKCDGSLMDKRTDSRKNRRPQKGFRLERKIKNDKTWELVFDDNTKGIDIGVNFQRVSIIDIMKVTMR